MSKHTVLGMVLGVSSKRLKLPNRTEWSHPAAMVETTVTVTELPTAVVNSFYIQFVHTEGHAKFEPGQKVMLTMEAVE